MLDNKIFIHACAKYYQGRSDIFPDKKKVSVKANDFSASNPKWTIGWGVTSRCDLACPFCYSKIARENIHGHSADCNLEHARAFIKRNAQFIRSINFGTGESFLMPQFADILKMCKKFIPGVRVAVTTNGAMIDSKESHTAMSVWRDSIDELDVSLDFACPEQHNVMRGKENAWARAVATAELAKQLGMEVSFVMVGTPQTLASHNVAAMLSIANHFQVVLRINLYMPTTGDFSFAPTFDDLYQGLSTVSQWSEAVRTSDPLLLRMGFGESCIAPGHHLHSVRLLPNSLLSPSTYLTTRPWAQPVDMEHFLLSDVSKMPQMAKWLASSIPKECALCEYRNICQGGSRERRILWYDSLLHRDPYCPERHGSHFEQCKKTLSGCSSTSILSWTGPQIHLDYLPTLVCRPKNSVLSFAARCAKALLITEGGDILLLKKAHGGEQWELPGGRIQGNERPLECLLREMREEMAWSPLSPAQNSLRWCAYEDYGLLLGETYIYCVPNRFEPTLSDEHVRSRWLNAKEAIGALSIAREWQYLYHHVVSSVHDSLRLSLI